MRRSNRRTPAAWVLLLLLILAGGSSGGAEEPGGVWLGLLIEDAIDGGVQVVAIVPGGPARRAGVRDGDVLVTADDVGLAGVEQLRGLLGERRSGQVLRLQILRSGRMLETPVELRTRGASVLAPKVTVDALRAPRLAAPDTDRVAGYGLVLTEVTPALRRYFGAPAGAGVLVTRIEPGQVAATAGLRVGDVLTRVGQTVVRAVDDVGEELLGSGAGGQGEIEAVLVRGGEARWVRLPRLAAAPAAPEPVERMAGSPPPPAAPASMEASVLLEKGIRAEIERLERRIAELQRQLEALDSPQGEAGKSEGSSATDSIIH